MSDYDYSSVQTSTLAHRDEHQLVQSTPIDRVGETSAITTAEQAKAAVQARYVMALQRPRNIENSRVRLLNACKRPRFAASAIYRKPIGGGTIEGPSARFAEEVLRCLGNVLPEAYAIYEDSEKLIQRVSVTDLENNLTFTRDITVRKTVERRKPSRGAEVISSRKNTTGQIVYLVRATEDEILVKLNSAISKAQRNLALMLLPSDIKEEAIDMCNRTINDIAARDPEAERKRMIDAFHGIGVEPADIEKYLGHPLKQVTTNELNDLRSMFTSIKEGEAKWVDFVSTKAEAQATSEDDKTTTAKAATKKKTTDQIVDEIKKKQQPEKPAPNPTLFMKRKETIEFLKHQDLDDLNLLQTWATSEDQLIVMMAAVMETMMPTETIKKGFLELVAERMK